MAEDEEPKYCDLIPSMVKETTLLCLAKLPPPMVAVGRCVCRSWRKALANPTSLRRSLSIPPNHRLFLALFQTECDPGYRQATHHNTEWLLLRKSSSSSSSSSSPTLSLCNPLSQISSCINLRSMAVNDSVLFPELPSLVDNKIARFLSYRLEDQRWSVVPSFPSGYKDIRLYACAALGDFIYFSGGRDELNEQATTSGVRYDTVNRRWESLPDMIMSRIDCTGIVLDDKFVVIGGSYKD
ncbi:F-box/kelch-repeat protein At5g60570 [Cryptomeria japonica]|uniref:F-box/kelch-repeat protein At5g60570 n=1 Tax=Cryptomeria japonica TaxID=3369 RepID=UPI0027DA2202|nr:F-box/kelch-repeat protein At5g60570 [Cryptomeria japonica]